MLSPEFSGSLFRLGPGDSEKQAAEAQVAGGRLVNFGHLTLLVLQGEWSEHRCQLLAASYMTCMVLLQGCQWG